MKCPRCNGKGTRYSETIFAGKIKCTNCDGTGVIDKTEKAKMKLIRMTLEQCYEKISLYNKASQEYLGGMEATRLLSNIRETIKIIDT